MLSSVFNFFSAKQTRHPLGDAREIKRVLAKLPSDAFKAIEEIYSWLESLRHADDFRLDRLHEVTDALDCAAQAPLQRLTQHYLRAPHLSKNEERRLWSMCFNYWSEVSHLYAHCADRLEKNPGEKGADAFRRVLPVAMTRLMAARSNQIKWINFRYGTISEDLWRSLGKRYLAAEAEGYAQKPVLIYPGDSVMSCVTQQYLQTLVRESSSMDALRPSEIELVNRIIHHLLPTFVFGTTRHRSSVYWIDTAKGEPPQRILNPPKTFAPSARFLQPGQISKVLSELTRSVERGTIPKELELGKEYSTATLLKVLQHLAQYWASAPPQRKYKRHAFKARMSVLKGFDSSLAVFTGKLAPQEIEHQAESWIVENISHGGFRAGAESAGDRTSIGTLLCLLPENSEHWMLGVVRRRGASAKSHHASISVQTLSHNPKGVELRPSPSSSSSRVVHGIWLFDENDTETIRLVLPSKSFNVRQPLEFVHGNKYYQLTPMEVAESGKDFEIASYRTQLVPI